ncbi:MAG: YgaP family membrane protein [Gemmatimonadaceae bacterium]
MCDDRVIRRFAGVFVLVSVALGYWLHPAWFLFTAFVGVNLLQSTVTAFCPLERVLGHLGWAGCRPRNR